MQVHSVLESLQQGILICDQHSRIVFFNQVYSDFIGVPLETAKGHKITDYRKSANCSGSHLERHPGRGNGAERGNAGILCKCLSDLGRASDPRKHLNCDESRTV